MPAPIQITELTTTTAAEAMGGMPNRHLDFDSTNRRWVALRNNGGDIQFWYASSPGSSWTLAGGTISVAAEGPTSFHIDVDDGFHLVYIDGGAWKYRYGTESAGTISWSGAISLSGNSAFVGDVVAHKDGSDYYAHCTTVDATKVYYRRIKITSGTPALHGSEIELWNTTGTPRACSIDFRHTGDGKTVAASSPDVWVSYQIDVTIYVHKLEHSAGPAWAAQTRATMPTGGFFGSSKSFCIFDGTAVMVISSNGTGNGLLLFERDADDTTTDEYHTGAISLSNVTPSGCVDADRNVYVTANNPPGGSFTVSHIKWTRDGETWDDVFTIGDGGDVGGGNLGCARFGIEGTLEVAYARDLATDEVAWGRLTSFSPSGYGWGAVPI